MNRRQYRSLESARNMYDYEQQSGVFAGLFRSRNIPHYYGDHVRRLFLVVAALLVITIPVWDGLFPLEVVPRVLIVLVLALLAGITTPHSKGVLLADAIIAGIGVFLFELIAINTYEASDVGLFLAREVVILMLLLAFYYSIKTYRAMLRRQTGKKEPPWEFEEGKSE